MKSTSTGGSGSGPVAERFVVPIAACAVLGVAIVAVVLRFVTRSDLWLDEALTVNIASLDLGAMLDALRHDGHPPAFYLLLHGWMDLFGTGDVAVRALPGLLSVATLPAAYALGARRGGRRMGVAVLVLAAITPFCVRYATETRMYSMVMLLVFAGLLLADDLRRGPSRWRWAALAAVTGLSLLTHYWVLFLGITALGVLAWAWWRHGRRTEALRIGSALAAGAVLFVPWLPSFLQQMAHTGTPWATAGRPTRSLTELLEGLGGGEHAEGMLFGAGVAVVFVLGALAWRDGPGRTVIGGRVRAEVAVDVALVLGTLGVGLAVGLVTDAVFVARYSAVFVPMILLVAGRGLTTMPTSAATAVVALALAATASAGLALNVVDDRTQGGSHAATIDEMARPGDVVAFCPDQLGPSTGRGLTADVVAVGIPALDSARFVDWVDYEHRNRSADASVVATSLVELADGGQVFLVTQDGYRTFETLCPALEAALTAELGPATLLAAADEDVFEPSRLVVFASRPR